MRPDDPRTMLGLEARVSDSPYVEQVWRSAARGGPMTSVATPRREIVFWCDHDGAVRATVRGPETAPTELDVPAGFSSFGIVLAHGAALPHLPAVRLVDDALHGGPLTSRGVVMRGEELPVPSYDTAEAFVGRLVRAGILVRDSLVDDVLAGGSTTVSARSVQRRVAATTGLTRGAVERVERAQRAAILLGGGASPLDVVGRLGYHDHPHLARSLTRYIGRGASWLRDPDTALSLPYKVDGRPNL